MDPGEEAILFQTLSGGGDGDKRIKNRWFIIQPPTGAGIFNAFPETMGETSDDFLQKKRIKTSDESSGEPEFCTESLLVDVSSTFVGSRLYTVGGREFVSSVPSLNISYLDMSNPALGWNRDSSLPHASCDSILGVHGDALFILPSPDPEWLCIEYDIPYYQYFLNVQGYIWNIKDNNKPYVIKAPKCGDGENRVWNTIRACAPLEGQGLLIAMDDMDGDKSNFFVHNGKPESDWVPSNSMNPLPKFNAPTSFAAKNGRIYILFALGEPPAYLYIYGIKEGRLICDPLPIRFPTLGINTWRSNMHVVPLSADRISFIWLGGYPCFKRVLYHKQVQVLFDPKPKIKVVIKEERFETSICEIFRCLPYHLQADLGGKTPVYSPLPPKESIFQGKNDEVTGSKLLGRCHSF